MAWARYLDHTLRPDRETNVFLTFIVSTCVAARDARPVARRTFLPTHMKAKLRFVHAASEDGVGVCTRKIQVFSCSYHSQRYVYILEHCKKEIVLTKMSMSTRVLASPCACVVVVAVGPSGRTSFNIARRFRHLSPRFSEAFSSGILRNPWTHYVFESETFQKRL